MGHKNPRKIPIPTGQIIKNAAGEPIGLRSVYGIHELEVYADQADKQQPSALDRALSIEKKLFEAASATLREAGEELDLEAVVGITDPITASDVLTEWCQQSRPEAVESPGTMKSSQAEVARTYGVDRATISRLASPLPFEAGAALPGN